MAAQAALHREILHVHAPHGPLCILLSWKLSHVLIFKCNFVAWEPVSTWQVTYTRPSTALQELLTTFGLMHTTRFDPDELAGELRGHTSFRNPRIPIAERPRVSSR